MRSQRRHQRRLRHGRKIKELEKLTASQEIELRHWRTWWYGYDADIADRAHTVTRSRDVHMKGKPFGTVSLSEIRRNQRARSLPPDVAAAFDPWWMLEAMAACPPVVHNAGATLVCGLQEDVEKVAQRDAREAAPPRSLGGAD